MVFICNSICSTSCLSFLNFCFILQKLRSRFGFFGVELAEGVKPENEKRDEKKKRRSACKTTELRREEGWRGREEEGWRCRGEERKRGGDVEGLEV